jgi:hypothetical protein
VESMKMPPESMDFLPDAAVLESVWRQEHDLAQRVAALRSVCSRTSGEDFFRAARRAVYLASLQRSRGWTHVHALRASTALWAWLLHRLTGISASTVIEPFHTLPPESLAPLISAFSFGSISDARVSGDLPNLFHPAPFAGHRGLFRFLSPSSSRSPAVNPASVWTQWLGRARENAER